MPEKSTKNKTIATWLAFVFGQLGLHRFYLFGFKDALAWLHPVAAAVGWLGVLRIRTLGQDDKLAWVLVPMLGLTANTSVLVKAAVVPTVNPVTAISVFSGANGSFTVSGTDPNTPALVPFSRTDSASSNSSAGSARNCAPAGPRRLALRGDARNSCAPVKKIARQGPDSGRLAW